MERTQVRGETAGQAGECEPSGTACAIYRGGVTQRSRRPKDKHNQSTAQRELVCLHLLATRPTAGRSYSDSVQLTCGKDWGHKEVQPGQVNGIRKKSPLLCLRAQPTPWVKAGSQEKRTVTEPSSRMLSNGECERLVLNCINYSGT